MVMHPYYIQPVERYIIQFQASIFNYKYYPIFLNIYDKYPGPNSLKNIQNSLKNG
jgi:hypothetical protein